MSEILGSFIADQPNRGCRYLLSAQHDRAFIVRADVVACIRAMEAAEDVNYVGAPSPPLPTYSNWAQPL